MSKLRVYLSGAMSGVDKVASDTWRKYVEKKLKNAVCFNPWDYFDFDNIEDEQEVMHFDLYKLKKTDIVLVDFTLNPKSLGTMAELGIAYDRHIPIIGICSDEISGLHPWQIEMCETIFSSLDAAIQYINEFYMED